MKVIYVAGPYRGATAWEIEENIREAEKIALQLWKAGYAAVCPHTNNRFFFGEIDEDSVLKGCLEILSRCDGVLLLSQWHRSEGARIEHAEALRLGIPVYFRLADLLP